MNWLLLLGGAIPALALSWLLHTVDVSRLEAKQRDALQTQATALKAQCTKDKEITTHAAQTYQDQIGALNRQLNALRLRPRPKCIMPVTRPSPQLDAASGKGKPAGSYGVSTGWLYDYAGEAERYRLQVIGLQGFIRDTWRANGQ